MKNIPQKIYLQTGHKNPVIDFKMLSLDDITWSSTRENDTDIEYDLSNHSVLHNIIVRSFPDEDTIINKTAEIHVIGNKYEQVGERNGFLRGAKWIMNHIRQNLT